MNTRFTILITLLLCTFSGYSQYVLQLDYEPYVSRFWDNRMFYNPSFAGSDQDLNIRGSFRSRFTTVADAPLTGNVLADAGNKHWGVGLNGIYSSYQGLRNLNTRVAGAYKFNFPGVSVALGLDLGFANAQFKYTDGSTNSQTRFDLGAGISVFSEDGYAGISLQHIPPIRFSELSDSTSIPRFLNVIAGYRFRKVGGSKIDFAPNVLMRSEFKSVSAEINANIYYSRFVGVGVTFKYNRYPTQLPIVNRQSLLSLAVNAEGTLYDSPKFQLKAGYLYDFLIGQNTVLLNQPGYHEIFLMIKIKRNKRTPAETVPAPEDKKE